MPEDLMIERTLIMLALWAALGVAGFFCERIINRKDKE